MGRARQQVQAGLFSGRSRRASINKLREPDEQAQASSVWMAAQQVAQVVGELGGGLGGVAAVIGLSGRNKDSQAAPALPVTTIHADGGKTVIYYRDNDATSVFDRIDGPAYIETFPDGSRDEHYFRGGLGHREDGPARVLTDATGVVILEQYEREGRLHREDGPALIRTSETTGARNESYYREGKLHREDGPAFISTTLDGGSSVEYRRDGQLHRNDGPALIETHADGSRVEKYYRQGLSDIPRPAAFVDFVTTGL